MSCTHQALQRRALPKHSQHRRRHHGCRPQGSPSNQFGKKQETTWSPTLNSVTPSPMLSTSLAPSDIGIRPSDTRLGVLTTPKSWKLSELACSRTLIAPGPGAPGSCSSTRSIRSRPPVALTMMAKFAKLKVEAALTGCRLFYAVHVMNGRGIDQYPTYGAPLFATMSASCVMPSPALHL